VFMLRYLSTNVVGGLRDSRLLNATWYELLISLHC
jgi:hypothetical protein